MQKHNTAYVSLLILTLFIMPLFVGCGGKYDFLSKNAIPLKIEEVNSSHAHSGEGGIPGDSGNEYQDIPSNSSGPLHPLFNGILGMQVSARSLSAVNPDATGLALENDYDGDGIPNDLELITNPFLTDYPRIFTRITTPIVMELRISETDNTENFTEVIEDKDVKETITNSMENKHYNQLN